MGQVIKVALSGYNAETDTDPDHFSLYVDNDDPNDYILVKEKATATVSVSGSLNIAHGLGYVPFCQVFAEVSTNVWRKIFGTPISGTRYFTVDGTNLTLYGTGNFKYYILYDNIT